MDGHFGFFSWPKLKVRAGRLKAGDPGSNAMKQGKKKKKNKVPTNVAALRRTVKVVGLGEVFHLAQARHTRKQT